MSVLGFSAKTENSAAKYNGGKGGKGVSRVVLVRCWWVDGCVLCRGMGGLLEGYKINRVVWEGVYIHTGLASTCRGKCSC